MKYTCNVYEYNQDELDMNLVTSEDMKEIEYLDKFIYSLEFRHIDWDEVEVRTYSSSLPCFGEPDKFVHKVVNSKSKHISVV